MDKSGFNMTEYNDLINKIRSNMADCGTQIGNKLQKKIVDEFGKCWYAPEAVTFFNSFKEVVESEKTPIVQAFNNFKAVLDSVMTNWAGNTGAEFSAAADFTTEDITLTITIDGVIKEQNGNNAIYLDESEADTIAANLESVQADIRQDVSDITKNLSADNTLIGHDQAANAQTCYDKIATALEQIFEFLTTELQPAINDAITKYQEIASSNNSTLGSV